MSGIKVELTGREDREGPWKTLVAGFGGSGKTLLASTAGNPLFVFFSDSPKIKSIADRAVPHVKLTNDVDADGRLTTAAHDKLHALLTFISLQDHKYDTLVLDTGNELFQEMKASRRLKNGGEFGPGDWEWLAITYREVIFATLEADLDVMVLYHIKNETLDEGVTYRDLLLQGSITPEVPTWFDEVGVMDSYEVINEDGDTVTRRAFLTSPSRLYPWLKDHSGNMPRRFEISPEFAGDYLKMRKLWVQAPEHSTLHEVIAEIPSAQEVTEESSEAQPVPSPEDLESKKIVSMASHVEVDPVTGKVIEKKPEAEVVEAAADTSGPPAEVPTPSPTEEQGEQPVEPEEVVPIGNMNEDDEAMDDPPEQEISLEEAERNVTEALDATEVLVCAECDTEIDEGLRDISQIRFRTNLCKEHYMEHLAAANG
jgi:hypothetical protein